MFNLLPRLFVLLFVLIATCSQAAEIPLSVYGALPGIDNPVLSPSGKRAALVGSVKGKQTFLVVEPGGAVLYGANADGLKIRSLHWAGENFVVVVLSTTQNLGWQYGFKHELSNVLVIDIAKAKHSLPLERAVVANAIFGYHGNYQENGNWYAYVGTLPVTRNAEGDVHITSNAHPRLSRIDLATGKIERVAEANKDGSGWLLDKNGEIIANERYNESLKVWSLYAGAHGERLITEARDDTEASSIQGQGRAPGTVLFTTHNAQDAAQHWEASLDGSKPPVEVFQDVSIRTFIHDPISGLLIGYLKPGNDREVVFFDRKHQERMQVARDAFPDHNVRFYSASDDFNRLIVETDGADDSGTWWLVDIPAADASPLGYNYPLVADRDVNPWRVVKYQAADGLNIEGILTLPVAAKPEKLPLVVMPHGGPEARDYPEFDWWAQAFANRGYAVWQPNFRGSAGYGAPFRNAGYGEFGRKMQTDISDGVSELVKQGIVDPKRACIVGASYGGYAALAGVTLQKDMYRCAVSVAGIGDLRIMLQDVNTRYRMGEFRYWLKYFGSTTGSDKALESISPVEFAKQANAPVLLIHGKDDTVVPIDQSTAMLRALTSAKKPVEMLTLDGEDHWLSLGTTRTKMLEAAVNFVQKNNPATKVVAQQQ